MIDIRKFRKERKLTQIAFGKLLGYTHAYISNIERGKESISDKFLDRFHAQFGLEVEPYKSYNQKVTPDNITTETSEEYIVRLKTELEQERQKNKELLEKYAHSLEENAALQRQLADFITTHTKPQGKQ